MARYTGQPWTPWLATFSVGERRYHETTLTNLDADRAAARGPRGKAKPKALRGMEFTVTTHTAVGSNGLGEVRYLVCVERVK